MIIGTQNTNFERNFLLSSGNKPGNKPIAANMPDDQYVGFTGKADKKSKEEHV